MKLRAHMYIQCTHTHIVRNGGLLVRALSL